MTNPNPQTTFDARPLTDPVDPREVSAFAAALRARGFGASTVGSIVTIAILVTVGSVVTLLVMSSFIGFAASHDSPALAAIPFVFLIAVFGGGGLLTWIRWRNGRVTRYRLHHFAEANGMTFEPKVTDPALPGMIFSIGRSRMATDLVRGSHPRFVEFGNYQYTVKSGKNSTTYTWGYVAVKLDVPLPNIVLDALGNNTLFGSNLPAAFEKQQRLSLEGDFDRYFTLYCPEGYERDALFLFTPDIMARFIDSAAQLDVEIVDDWLFLYTKRDVSTLDPSTWAWLFGAVGALLTKLDQWARWRDERLLLEQPAAAVHSPATGAGQSLPFAAPAGMLAPPPGVAAQGRRLKRRFQWVPIVAALIFDIVWIWLRFN